MSRRTRWMLQTFASAACFAAGAIVFVLDAAWSSAAMAAVCSLCLALAGQTQRYAYRTGFFAGVLDFTRALRTGDSPVMHSKTPEPWDELAE